MLKSEYCIYKSSVYVQKTEPGSLLCCQKWIRFFMWTLQSSISAQIFNYGALIDIHKVLRWLEYPLLTGGPFKCCFRFEQNKLIQIYNKNKTKTRGVSCCFRERHRLGHLHSCEPSCPVTIVVMWIRNWNVKKSGKLYNNNEKEKCSTEKDIFIKRMSENKVYLASAEGLMLTGSERRLC